MHSILAVCSGILAFSALASASYRDHPRNYQVRSLRANNTSTHTSPTTSSSIHIDSSTSSTSISSSSSIIITTTSQPPTCLGSVTYYATTPPTVYETVTVPFTVTVTAANVSLTTPAIYTPPPPCFQSILTAASSTKCTHNCPLNSVTLGETLTGSAYTSTVLVTKKTPVPTVVPNTSAPPNFHTPSSTPQTSPTPAPGDQPGSPTPPPGGSSAAPAPGKSQGGGDGQTSAGGNGNSPAPSPSKNQGSEGSQATTKAAGNSPAPTGGKGGQTITPNIGSLVNSGINGPVPSTPAANQGIGGASGPKPTTANVNGVPVIVLPSSSGVVIGGQIVSVPPAGSSTKVVANGNTFTLGKSAIIGPSTTIALAADQAGSSPTIVTANGLTFKVGATQAIISGKTYAIGSGAPTTTLTIGGQTVVVGPSGVGVPGKTIAPEKATAGASMAIATAGRLTVTYDKTEAIVGSSTYRIGQGAPQTIVTVNGKTVSLGAGGIGLASSTIPPAKVTAGPVLSAVTVDGVSFSIDATEVVIGSSTFRIGSGAPTETTVINGMTVSIGPSGVGLDSTTVHPPTATAGLQTGSASRATVERLLSSSVLLILAASLACFLS